MCLFVSYELPCKHSVYGCFAHGHGDMRNRILVESGPLGELLGGQLNLVHAVKRRIESEADTACR